MSTPTTRYAGTNNMEAASPPLTPIQDPKTDKITTSDVSTVSGDCQARRRGAKRAIVAVGRSVLVVIWHLLSDPEAAFHDLGPDFHDSRINPPRQARNPTP